MAYSLLCVKSYYVLLMTMTSSRWNLISAKKNISCSAKLKNWIWAINLNRGFNLNFCWHALCVGLISFGACYSAGRYIFCWLQFLFFQYFCLTVGWTPLQHTCLSEWASWILDVLLIKCISLQYFLAAEYWVIYSSVYRICRTPSSSNPGRPVCHSLNPQPTQSTSHLACVPSICPLFFLSLPLQLFLFPLHFKPLITLRPEPVLVWI